MLEIKDIKRIGLITGNGKFPLLLCQAAKGHNIDVVVIAVKDELDTDLSRYVDKTYWVELGQGGKTIEILKKENIKYAIMAGKIKKTTILKQSFKMDKVARDILKNLIDKGDDTILKAIADRLKTEGIELLDSTKFLNNLLAKKGIYTKIKPTPSQREDINFGFKIAKAIGGLDIGQAVIIKDKVIIAVEAIEGTDEAIIRAGNLSSGAVVVKVSKPSQDMRFDVPTVGLNTIQAMEKANANVLAIEAEKTLILEKEMMIKEADKAGICIIAV